VGRERVVFGAAAAAGLLLLAGCGSGSSPKESATEGGGATARPAARTGLSRTIPQVGPRLRARIPAASRQVVAVYGRAPSSATATVVLYEKHGAMWKRTQEWPAHNGKRGWTTDHHVGDKRSPVGVFTLSDAGGVLPDPGAKLPYTASAAFTPPSYWPSRTRHDFDYVIAVDYNRVRGTSPLDPRRPQGQAKGGGIWIHMDHGSGTSACVSVSKPAMRSLLRRLDPKLHPVVVMGDRADLAS
jgi:L,D-peptidoglycan transpeptidase YkuD (ErfK/YbiS/YcfS/YnhG family)